MPACVQVVATPLLLLKEEQGEFLSASLCFEDQWICGDSSREHYLSVFVQTAHSPLFINRHSCLSQQVESCLLFIHPFLSFPRSLWSQNLSMFLSFCHF